MSSDCGNSTSSMDCNLIKSMTMSSFSIFLPLAGFHKNPESKMKGLLQFYYRETKDLPTINRLEKFQRVGFSILKTEPFPIS